MLIVFRLATVQTYSLLVLQIYRDKLRAEVEGKPFTVPPPSQVSAQKPAGPSPSSRRNITNSSASDGDWGDWGDSGAAGRQPGMRVGPYTLQDLVAKAQL